MSVNTSHPTGYTLVGPMHEALSRQNARETIAQLDEARANADASTYAGLTRSADSARGALAVRTALTVLTVPLDAMFGTQRLRDGDGQAGLDCNKSVERTMAHPCDAGVTGIATGLVSAAAIGGATLVGAIGGASTGQMIGKPKAGVKVGLMVTTVPVAYATTWLRIGIAEVTALPSLAIKAAGSGLGGAVGFLYGAVHGPLAARGRNA